MALCAEVFKNIVLMKILGGSLDPLLCFRPAQAISITLAWNQSLDPAVVGYNIYYGGASGDYTNKIVVSNATMTTIPGLIPGVTYYFAATDYNASGLESSLSGEMSYTVPTPARGMTGQVLPGRQMVLTLTGPVGHAYDILATQEFKTWTLSGTVTIGAMGTVVFTDPNAASYSRRFYRTRG